MSFASAARPRPARRLFLVLAVAALLPSAHARAGSVFVQRNLVSDGFVPAEHTDDNLKNPWGMAFNPDGGPFWIANQVTGTSTVYNGNGDPFPIGSPLVVRTPQNATGPAGPTGTAFNATNSFNLTSGGKNGKGLFFFATSTGRSPAGTRAATLRRRCASWRPRPGPSTRA